jgi:BlaI family transcriptional regulator, penicillinase repressor
LSGNNRSPLQAHHCGTHFRHHTYLSFFCDISMIDNPTTAVVGLRIMKSFRLPADDLEYAVLALLWELRTASVRELHEQLGVPAGNVYTTTAKVVDRLRDKGLIARRRKGSVFVYSPTVDRGEVERVRARQLVSRFLGPRPHAAVAALVEAVDEIDPQLLEELDRVIQHKRRQRHGS